MVRGSERGVGCFVSNVVLKFLTVFCNIISDHGYVVKDKVVMVKIAIIILPFAAPRAATLFKGGGTECVKEVLNVVLVTIKV